MHFGAGNTHLMSNPASSRSSAYQSDFCLEREVEHLQERVQAALPPAAPLQLPPQGWGTSRAARRGAGAPLGRLAERQYAFSPPGV